MSPEAAVTVSAPGQVALEPQAAVLSMVIAGLTTSTVAESGAEDGWSTSVKAAPAASVGVADAVAVLVKSSVPAVVAYLKVTDPAGASGARVAGSGVTVSAPPRAGSSMTTPSRWVSPVLVTTKQYVTA